MPTTMTGESVIKGTDMKKYGGKNQLRKLKA